MKNEVCELLERLEDTQRNDEKQRQSLRFLEARLAQVKNARLEQQALHIKQLLGSEARAAAAEREVEILTNSVQTLKTQLHQMQEFLASREQEHRLASSKKKYLDLEEEFRMALYLETSRYKELEKLSEDIQSKYQKTKQSLSSMQKKESETAALVLELTELVKEQKSKLGDLWKVKSEVQQLFKARIADLECRLMETAKQAEEAKFYKEENEKLKAQVTYLEEQIKKLEEELRHQVQELLQQREVSCKELHHLEIKVGALQSEVRVLKDNLQQEQDTVKIKTKIIEDNIDTIDSLKKTLHEKAEEIQRVKQESAELKQSLEKQLMNEANINQDLQVELNDLIIRKEELKDQVMQLKADLELQKKYLSEWKTKATMIGQMEVQVKGMKQTWEDKEKRLSEDRDRAIEAAGIALQKLRSQNEAFNKQLEAIQQEYQAQISTLNDEKQHEIREANKRVEEVESEMRQLLQDTSASKKGLEEKLRQLTLNMKQLQMELR